MERNARFDIISSLTEDAKISLTYKDFTISEIRELIKETPLTELDRKIAEMRYLELRTFDEIAEKVGMETRSVQRRVPKISVSIKNTTTKLYVK